MLRLLATRGLTGRLVSRSSGAACSIRGANEGVGPSTSSAPRITATSPSYRRCLSTAAEPLSDILRREIAEEEANESAVMPAPLAELKTQLEESWRIVDSSSGVGGPSGGVKMFRRQPVEGTGAKVTVCFHCQDVVPSEESAIENMFASGGEDDDGEEEANAVRFSVMISSAGKTCIYTCLSEDGVVNVERVAMAMDSDDVEKIISDGGVDEKEYQGPEFSELAEDLQESLCTYVEEDCGVDSDVAAFISMYADYQEQVGYLGWLKAVRSIL